MFVPILNIILGLAAAIGGATGQWALAGTDSALLLTIAGCCVAALGLFQLIRAMRQS
jgi:hypothetical protein